MMGDRWKFISKEEGWIISLIQSTPSPVKKTSQEFFELGRLVPTQGPAVPSSYDVTNVITRS